MQQKSFCSQLFLSQFFIDQTSARYGPVNVSHTLHRQLSMVTYIRPVSVWCGGEFKHRAAASVVLCIHV